MEYGPDPHGYFAAPLSTATLPVPAPQLGPPPYVVAAVTSLALASVAAAWVALTGLVALNAFGGTSDGPSLLKALFLLANAAGNGVLGVWLLQGVAPARALSSLLCGGWTLYWLAQAGKARHALGLVTDSPFGGSGVGQLATMATLGVLLLAGWAAATAALLWAPGNSRHFSG